MSHPFGDLLKQYRRRRPGLTQQRLAHMIGYDEAVLVRMSQGKKDLTGPSGRDRVLRLIETLKSEGALHTLDEANALLAAAQMPPLYSGIPVERVLINALKPAAIPALPVTMSPLRFTLPSPASSFVGREEDIAEIEHLLQSGRLVTLTGAGGSGKTRLAIEAGARQASEFTHGACFVALAATRHVHEVMPAIAQALQVREADSVPLLDAIKRFLVGKSLLLVLDNFEHILDGAPVVSDLLMAAPKVKVLATSREPLRLSGEHVFIVEPLVLPRAVELFMQRAKSVEPAFRLTHANEPAVMDICRRMDGLPLAIELAAARVRHYSLDALLSNLNEQRGLGVLTDAPRDVPARHQTLRSAITWSYELLRKNEQRVLCVMGVFVGGAEVDQIAQVVSGVIDGHGNLDVPAVETCLQSLSDKNLLRKIEQPDGTQRYFAMELIREFTLEQLSAQTHLRDALRAHAEAFVNLATQSVLPIRGHGQLRWHSRLERDIPNFRSALNWSFGPDGDAVLGCRLVSALAYFWFIATQYVAESRTWLRKAYAEENIPDEVRAGVLEAMFMHNDLWALPEWTQLGRKIEQHPSMQDVRGRAIAAYNISAGTLNGNPHDTAALQLAQKCLELVNETGDEWLKGRGLLTLAVHAQGMNDLPRAESLYREIVTLRRNIGNVIEASIGLWQLAGVVTAQGRLHEANDYLREAALLAKRLNSPEDLMHAECELGNNLRLLGEVQAAIAVLSPCATMARERLPAYDLVLPLINLSFAQADAGDPSAARTTLHEATQIMHSDHWEASHPFWRQLIDASACTAAATGADEHAAKLWGAADVLWKQPRSVPVAEALARLQSKVRDRLGDARYATAHGFGSTLTLEDAIALASANVAG